MSDSRKPNDPSNVTPNESSIWDDARITAYVMGELSAEETSVFEQAISDDPELSAAVDQARQVTDELQSLYAGESHGTLDHNRRDQILAASVQSSANVASAQLASTNSMRRYCRWRRCCVY